MKFSPNQIFIFSACALLFSIQTISAQVGINTSAPTKGTILDINSSDKGIMIPRLDVTNLSTIAPITEVTTAAELAAAEGLLIYNTNTSTGEGFHYWDGSVWLPLHNIKNLYTNDDRLKGDRTLDFDTFNLNFDNQDREFNLNNGNASAARSRDQLLFSFGDSDSPTDLRHAIKTRHDAAANDGNSIDFYVWQTGVDATDDIGSTQTLSLGTDIAVFNENGGDIDFRVESDDQENMIYVDGEENQVFIRNNVHHIATYIDPFNSYANAINDGSGTTGIQYAIAGWNQGTLGGGINGVIEDTTNAYAAIEGATDTDFGIAVKGLSVLNSNASAVQGIVPTTGTWLGFGGVFYGGLGYQGGIYNVSDARIKKDIKTIDGALEKIKNIDGVSFQYDFAKYSENPIQDTNTYYGFTAQNVKEQLPHAVKEKSVVVSAAKKRNIQEKEILQVVDYTAVIPVLVEAMKEQQAIIETLKEEVEVLKAKK